MTSYDQTDALDTSSIQPEDIGISRSWAIEVNPTGSISILGLNKCAHELGIPKSTKRIMKKRVKKKIIEILERTVRGY